jgi:hypothetical protein
VSGRRCRRRWRVPKGPENATSSARWRLKRSKSPVFQVSKYVSARCLVSSASRCCPSRSSERVTISTSSASSGQSSTAASPQCGDQTRCRRRPTHSSASGAANDPDHRSRDSDESPVITPSSWDCRVDSRRPRGDDIGGGHKPGLTTDDRYERRRAAHKNGKARRVVRVRWLVARLAAGASCHEGSTTRSNSLPSGSVRVIQR